MHCQEEDENDEVVDQVMWQLAKDPGHHSQVLEVVVGLEQRVALHSRV